MEPTNVWLSLSKMLGLIGLIMEFRHTDWSLNEYHSFVGPVARAHS